MNRLLLWVTTAVLGAAATLLTSFGLLAVILFLLLASPLVLRGDRVVALSGMLTGFGGFWSFLIARQLASGGTTDNPDVWMAVGVVPFVLGCALAVLAATRTLRARSPATDQDLAAPLTRVRSRAGNWTLRSPADGGTGWPRQRHAHGQCLLVGGSRSR